MAPHRAISSAGSTPGNSGRRVFAFPFAVVKKFGDDRAGGLRR
jgi:hypothetical protein